MPGGVGGAAPRGSPYPDQFPVPPATPRECLARDEARAGDQLTDYQGQGPPNRDVAINLPLHSGLGPDLRGHRKAARITQAGLARATGLSVPTIRLLEAGRGNLDSWCSGPWPSSTRCRSGPGGRGDCAPSEGDFLRPWIREEICAAAELLNTWLCRHHVREEAFCRGIRGSAPAGRPLDPCGPVRPFGPKTHSALGRRPCLGIVSPRVSGYDGLFWR